MFHLDTEYGKIGGVNMATEELRDDFIKVCSICLDNDMLVDEFCRLKKIKRPDKIGLIEKQIDKACGYDAGMDFMKQFTDFVMGFIYIPVLAQQIKD